MAVDQWQDRIEALEEKVTRLQPQLDLRTKELAYPYIHSNWTLIRWYLAREQDQSGQGSETHTSQERRDPNRPATDPKFTGRSFRAASHGRCLPLAHRDHSDPEGERVYVLRLA